MLGNQSFVCYYYYVCGYNMLNHIAIASCKLARIILLSNMSCQDYLDQYLANEEKMELICSI